MKLLGKRVEFNGRIGTITVVTRDTERVVVEFTDGEFAGQSLLMNISDLEPIDNDKRRKGT